MTFTAAGSLTSSEPTPANPATFSLTTHTNGNFVLFEAVCNTQAATGVSGGGCTWTQLSTTVNFGSLAASGNIWLGTVTSAGTATVTVSFGGTPGTCRFVCREFSTTTGSVTLDAQDHIDGQTSNWASLTPSGSGRLYWGYAKNNSSAVAGSTSGFTYEIDSFSNGEGYCTSVSSAYQPVWGDSTQLTGVMVLVEETSSSVTADAGLAAGTGTAQSPSAAVIPAAGLAAGTGTAQSPSAVITPAAGLAAATGTAQSPVAAVTPAAVLAAGTGAAQSPVPAVIPGTGLAVASGTAQQPSAAVTVTAGLASGTGAAQPPVPAVSVTAGLAAGTGAALNPSVSTSGNVTANAGLATGTGAALNAIAVIPGQGALIFAAGTPYWRWAAEEPYLS